MKVQNSPDIVTWCTHSCCVTKLWFMPMCLENRKPLKYKQTHDTHKHIHTFILRHFVQTAVGGERAQPPPHNGNGSMSGIDAHEPASRSNSLPQARRLVVHFGWFFWSLPELSVSEENERLRHQQPKAKKWQTKHPISQPMRQINVKSRNSSAGVAKEKLPIPMGNLDDTTSTLLWHAGFLHHDVVTS